MLIFCFSRAVKSDRNVCAETAVQQNAAISKVIVFLFIFIAISVKSVIQKDNVVIPE